MKYRRICLEKTRLPDDTVLHRGHEYTTSAVKFGTLTVYLKGKEYRVTSGLFAGAMLVAALFGC